VKNRPKTAKVGFLKTEPRKPSFQFVNFEVGSVTVFRKPISDIFNGFHTRLTHCRCYTSSSVLVMLTCTSGCLPHESPASAVSSSNVDSCSLMDFDGSLLQLHKADDDGVS